MQTLKKYFYIIIILVALAFSFYAYFILGNQMRSWRALSESRMYVTKMYSEYFVMGQVCQGEDTDNDGYVSCDLRIKSSQREDVINLQCPTLLKSYLGTSCKESRLMLTN